jgi:uncharacterized protein
MRRILYLHGFASSPLSKKAQFFRNKFADCGVELEVPELATEGFERLTVSGQLNVIERLGDGQPLAIIGSSMGGYLAALYASRHPEVTHVVMMAPAFGFARRWGARIGEESFARWKAEGFLEVHHYGEGRPARVGYELIEDGLKYPEEPEFPQAGLIFHGWKDEVVPAGASIRYAGRNPHVKLQLFEAGHELTEVTESMWVQASRFLGLAARW